MSEERNHSDRVVVGIDGSKASRHAVRWAAAEARIRQTSLIITHVAPLTTDAADREPAAAEATTLLEHSAVVASQQEPGVPVGTMLLRGAATDELIQLSRSSAMLVLGLDQQRTRASHGSLGSLEDRVVAHAECPVVTVNSSVRSFGPSHPSIVVGWTNDKTGHRALVAAAAEAEIRNATLTIVSVEPLPDATRLPGARAARRGALGKAENLVRNTHSGVALEFVQSSGEVSQALVRHSLHADLLVVGCHHTGDRWSLRTGPVAEAVMRQAGCPVMLVGRLGSGQVAAEPLADQHDVARAAP